ncbi:hypothetical protein B0P06_003828 [Clostridium saccharoperbutylacetonicum]|uniref:Uncharacterized protein n=1 Tax=Clostridium saccharoperbutylacetonicum N1-4(HMT) TaxID=931276 RepID=M1MNT7_9CLOT|nr:hypothetical protein [Clostridium saccharoperbutylacetonicum]AGF57863.1 hypothetical protein Cspa_c41100 [Clostridium saccharoperbutylacetonicum N1-4(HMT)]NRT61365.1 hypothetical protein [Clostridium saccharoperbutylacetonicum]NSB24683.1 hypothetical protein [Clostridium saccharoperbutylacetonicum]NSB44057.1 hypothetical protein [Clostridium saccharoperbutylacetonicum]
MEYDINRKSLLLAIKRNELDDFLVGRGVYSFGFNPYRPGDSMLDLDNAMAEIYKYYIDEPNERIDLLLEKTLLDWLTWKSGIGVYAVFLVLSYQLKMEKSKESPFNINKKYIIMELRKSALKYEDKLKNRKEYEGENLVEGLWEAMQLENKRNIKNYDIEIL